jgi:hypothetical protein
MDGMNPRVIERLEWDDEALWSFTEYNIARDICIALLSQQTIGSNSVIVDAFAGAGGNTMAFMMFFERVYAIEVNADRKKMLDHNVQLVKQYYPESYNVITRNDFYQNVDILPDIVFFDPPWGANYRAWNNPIHCNGPDGIVPFEDLIFGCRARISVVKVPDGYNIAELNRQLIVGGVGYIFKTKSYPIPNTMHVLFICYVMK